MCVSNMFVPYLDREGSLRSFGSSLRLHCCTPPPIQLEWLLLLVHLSQMHAVLSVHTHARELRKRINGEKTLPLLLWCGR